jgi:hypothetical protein
VAGDERPAPTLEGDAPIRRAARWYLRYGLSYRDVEELLVERGVEVDRVTVYRWVQRFTPLLADAARFARHAPGDRWHVDETYVKVNGTWRYVYRAVDQHGQVIDVLVSTRRDAKAARRLPDECASGPMPDRIRRLGRPQLNHNGLSPGQGCQRAAMVCTRPCASNISRAAARSLPTTHALMAPRSLGTVPNAS